jgi:hypothetical protein
MLASDSTGIATKVLQYTMGMFGCWNSLLFAGCQPPMKSPRWRDSLRVALLMVMMEFEYADAVGVIWCWMIEPRYASDKMWHVMIRSTAYFSTRKVGSDRVD